MHDILTLILVWLTGGVLGAIFFGGLLWTVRRVATSRHPALLVFCSLVLRMGISLYGFYIIADQQWDRMLLCLLGFIMVRFIITWMTRPRPVQDVSRAP